MAVRTEQEIKDIMSEFDSLKEEVDRKFQELKTKYNLPSTRMNVWDESKPKAGKGVWFFFQLGELLGENITDAVVST